MLGTKDFFLKQKQLTSVWKTWLRNHVEILLLQRVSVLDGAFGLSEKLIMVNFKINLQSFIELKVLSTKDFSLKQKNN